MIMCDPNLCPSLVTFDVAERRLDELGDLHENPALARGAIAACRRSHEAVRERYPCDGPVTNTEGQIRCPLGALYNDVHTLATVPSHRAGWAFDTEKLVDGGTDSQSGQYL
jgi:hypothetical protein